MNQKKISVCIATFNGEKYIEEQVNSIRTQIKEFDEIVISDDGSTDNTLTIVENLQDSRIKIFPNIKKTFKYGHYYVSNNFENAIKNSTGDIIFLCDQDDIWYSNRVESVLTYLEHYDLVINNASVINNEHSARYNFFSKKISFPRGLFQNILFPKYHGCCMVFDRNVIEYILPFPNKLILHDSWIGILVEKFGKVYYLDQNLIQYRRHSNNTSYLSGKSNNTLIFKLYYRLDLLFKVFKRIVKIKITTSGLTNFF